MSRAEYYELTAEGVSGQEGRDYYIQSGQEILRIPAMGNTNLDGAGNLLFWGVPRADTEALCEGPENGFITQMNWNLLGEGVYFITLQADEGELHTHRFTVTTFGEEFVRGARGECTIADFPSPGQSARFWWEESLQNLVLVNPPPSSVEE